MTDIKDIMAQCYASTKMTAQVLFPDRFDRPFSALHDQIFTPLDDPTIQKLVIKAPRGWGKTSTVNMASPAKHILFREKKFIVPISNTSTQAIMQSENLKRELRTNRIVRHFFGDVKTNDADGIDPTFSKEMWIANGETLVFPRGAGQQVRGILFGNYRPDFIPCDDLEDSESVRSEEQREKMKEWFFADVLNSIDRSKKNWKVVVVGTLLHEASLLADLLADQTWHHVELDLCSDDLRSNWPDFISDDEVKALYNSFRIQGLLDTFYREYRGMPVGKETNFRKEYFRYYNEADEEFRKKTLPILENVVIIDPAKTTNWESADSAIVGIGVDASAPRIYLRDIDAGRFHPDEIYDRAFAMADRLRARVIGYEVTSLNEFITYPITTEMLKRKKYYQLVELKARDKKENRISMLLPFYRMGYIYHNETCSPQMEAQLLSFPRSKRWDIMDAFAYVIELLEAGERYFTGANDQTDEQYAKEVDKELNELEAGYDDVKPLQGWRVA
jgi:hypothetical protein